MFPLPTSAPQTGASSMFTDFQYLDLFPLSIFDLLNNLFVAIICGLIISWVYRFTYNGAERYPTTFVNSLVILPIITSIIILLIGNNVARAFGLVGAMSIIRFRTAVRDTQDIIFIFFALAMGMAAGVNLGVTAIVSTFVIGTVISILIKTSSEKSNSGYYYHLALRYETGQENESIITTLFSTYCVKTQLVIYEKQETNNLITNADYLVAIKKEAQIDDLVKQLNHLLVDGYISSQPIVSPDIEAVKDVISAKRKKRNKKQKVSEDSSFQVL